MHIGPSKGKITCAACKKTISGARTVINGMWHCADCTYLHDYPDKEVAVVKPQPALRLQKEKLFDVPAKPKGGRRDVDREVA